MCDKNEPIFMIAGPMYMRIYTMEQVFLKTWASLSQVVHTQSLSSIIGYSSHVGNIAPMYATLGHLTERDGIAAHSPFVAVTRQPATQILPSGPVKVYHFCT